jgi:2',3'-cyclic-nucleotide 2'-phosphodiesterase (5'-nucleotidase family)
MKSKKIGFLLLCLIALSACKPLHIVEYNASKISISETTNSTNSDIANYIALYHDSLEKEMGLVIAQNTTTLTKRQPESTLGNLLVDALMNETNIALGKKVDIAILNNGGIRLPQLPSGDVTVGKVYELMPFDNMVVVQEFTGVELQQFFNSMAYMGGWPVAGATYVIENRKAAKLKIGGEPLSYEKKYSVALSDYLANGGDKLDMLKIKPQENTGILLRDMFLQNFARKKVLTSAVEGRVIIQNDIDSE